MILVMVSPGARGEPHEDPRTRERFLSRDLVIVAGPAGGRELGMEQEGARSGQAGSGQPALGARHVPGRACFGFLDYPFPSPGRGTMGREARSSWRPRNYCACYNQMMQRVEEEAPNERCLLLHCVELIHAIRHVDQDYILLLAPSLHTSRLAYQLVLDLDERFACLNFQQMPPGLPVIGVPGLARTR